MVDRLFPGATVVCLASGPSLCAEDVGTVRGRFPLVAVNDAVQLAPFAEVLYSSDAFWWKRAKGAPTFTGPKFTVANGRNPREKAQPGVTMLRNTGDTGLELDPAGLRTGKNSGYAAINLAVHLGASRILLLGYDLGLGPNGQRHFHSGPTYQASPYGMFLKMFATLKAPLEQAGVSVVNCSRATRLATFPVERLAEFLQAEVAA